MTENERRLRARQQVLTYTMLIFTVIAMMYYVAITGLTGGWFKNGVMFFLAVVAANIPIKRKGN